MVVSNGMRCRLDLELVLVDGHLVLVAKHGGDFLERDASRVGPVSQYDHPTDESTNDENEKVFPTDIPEELEIL
jgi:hypothetical protein